MQDIRIAIIQTDLLWEDIPGNLAMFEKKIADIKEPVDLIILPEMFNTAFSMNPSVCSEPAEGRTMQWIKGKAIEKKCTIAGSFLVEEDNHYYNRLVWMNPDGNYQFYNKKHLFRFAGEHEVFTAGKEKITPLLKGWNFRPYICYDMRFPVWSMNTYTDDQFGFDCLIYVANWPEKRRKPWISLAVARAIDNQSFVIAVNRVGKDGNGNSYTGDSMVVDPRGKIILQIPANKEATEIVTLSYSGLKTFREQFRVALDWDKFSMEE